MQKIVGFLRLMRPANIVTAVADILAGIAISGILFSGVPYFPAVGWLVLSTIGLYGGGVVMNDVFDARLDAVERPERPIPRGLVSRTQAAALGVVLLGAGVIFAFLVSTLSGGIALVIALAAVAYDKWSKHNAVIGPVNMGVCRGLNLLLGVSIVPDQVPDLWYLALIPVVYIAAITMISKGEVHGGRKTTLYAAAALYVISMTSILYISSGRHQVLPAAMFIFFWALMVFIPLKNAMRRPEGRMIGRAVKAGVLALILMNAAWASAFGAIYLALLIALLLPVSILLAKMFAVT